MKAILAVVVLALAASVAEAANPAPAKPRHNPLRKLGRGVANVLFGAVEIPNEYTKAVADDGGAAGPTHGVIKGTSRAVGRELAGVYEILTFPFPNGKANKPLMKPEFPNEDFEP